MVTDLRTATEFTYTNYIDGISGCAAAPSTDIVWVTAEVSGRVYPAANSQIEIHSIVTALTPLFPFPGLIMTDLHPGDQITMVTSRSVKMFNKIELESDSYPAKSTTKRHICVLIPITSI